MVQYQKDYDALKEKQKVEKEILRQAEKA